MSMAVESSPAANIFNFSHKCGSGVNGASASMIATTPNGIVGSLSSHFIIGFCMVAEFGEIYKI